MKPATISSFLGVRNVAQSRKQPLGALAEAVNVDVDDEGVIVSRLGYAKSLALTSVTAAFAPVNADVAYVVDNGTLKQITPGLQSISLGSVSTKDTHWLEIGMRIFMSTGYLIDNGELKAWFIDPPNPPLIQITSGNLPAGQYQITFTTLADDGRESPSCAVSTLNLSADSGLQLSGVDQCNVYLSDANGSNLYYVGYEVRKAVNNWNSRICAELIYIRLSKGTNNHCIAESAEDARSISNGFAATQLKFITAKKDRCSAKVGDRCFRCKTCTN